MPSVTIRGDSKSITIKRLHGTTSSTIGEFNPAEFNAAEFNVLRTNTTIATYRGPSKSITVRDID